MTTDYGSEYHLNTGRTLVKYPKFDNVGFGGRKNIKKPKQNQTI